MLESCLDFVRGIRCHAPGHLALAACNWTFHPALGRWIAVAKKSMRIEQVPTLLAELIGTWSHIGSIGHDFVLRLSSGELDIQNYAISINPASPSPCPHSAMVR